MQIWRGGLVRTPGSDPQRNRGEALRDQINAVTRDRATPRGSEYEALSAELLVPLLELYDHMKGTNLSDQLGLRPRIVVCDDEADTRYQQENLREHLKGAGVSDRVSRVVASSSDYDTTRSLVFLAHTNTVLVRSNVLESKARTGDDFGRGLLEELIHHRRWIRFEDLKDAHHLSGLTMRYELEKAGPRKPSGRGLWISAEHCSDIDATADALRDWVEGEATVMGATVKTFGFFPNTTPRTLCSVNRTDLGPLIRKGQTSSALEQRFRGAAAWLVALQHKRLSEIQSCSWKIALLLQRSGTVWLKPDHPGVTPRALAEKADALRGLRRKLLESSPMFREHAPTVDWKVMPHNSPACLRVRPEDIK